MEKDKSAKHSKEYEWYDVMTHAGHTDEEHQHQLVHMSKSQDELIHKNHLELLREVAQA